jgi:transcriptional regulator with PAS, ATPase and Fis domain
MREVFGLLARFAQTDMTVTLLGETGTGKDVLAHALHDQSRRAAGPFVVFDCGAVAANLVESELLGHERGSFTGAIAAHSGAFERAHTGTLFLDEIGELPLDLQPRLLRALESRKVRRVGGTRERAVDVRIVTATNRDLRGDVSTGKFREDLYFRLAGALVPVPPLRERIDDLALLVENLLGNLGHPHVRLAENAFAVLRAHAWPGNVRELKNALACAIAFIDAGSHVIEAHHLILLPPAPEHDVSLDAVSLGGQRLEHIERAAITQTMVQTSGNKPRAAEALGISVSALCEKLKKYSL